MSRESDFEAGKAMCPYYKGSSAREHYIRCEGVEGAVTVKLNYSGKERQRVAQLETRCFRCFDECAIYRENENKY